MICFGLLALSCTCALNLLARSGKFVVDLLFAYATQALGLDEKGYAQLASFFLSGDKRHVGAMVFLADFVTSDQEKKNESRRLLAQPPRQVGNLTT